MRGHIPSTPSNSLAAVLQPILQFCRCTQPPDSQSSSRPTSTRQGVWRGNNPPEPSKKLAQKSRFAAKAAASGTSNLLREQALPPPTGSTCSWKDFLGWLHPAVTTAHPDEGGSCSSAVWGSHGCFWGCLSVEQKCSSPRVMLVLQLGGTALVLWAGSDAKSSKTLYPSVRRAGLYLKAACRSLLAAKCLICKIKY